MPTKTLYWRSDSHTINGLSAYKIWDNRTGSGGVQSQSGAGSWTDGNSFLATYNVDIIKRNSAGSETTLGSAVAQTTRINTAEWGIQSATWNCPLTTMQPGDAIKFVENCSGQGCSLSVTGITPKLGASKLKAVTWTIQRYSYNQIIYQYGDPGVYAVYLGFFHGDSTYDSQISNVQYALAGGFACAV